MSEKWIALVGDPNTGFIMCGPFPSAEAIDDAPVEHAYYLSGTGYWSVPLKKPSVEDANNLDVPLPDDAGYDPNGTAIVFAGDITSDWHEQFWGPFRDLEAAQQYCTASDGLGINCAIELKPVPVKEPA